jgi:ribonuclease BN (tRNA processing enzyme)
MQLTVLGGSGAWPTADQACSGYLIEHAGFHLLLDPGYATLPRLLELLPADRLNAVFVSHGHPDHCADLNALLRARALQEAPPPGAIDAVLALDKPGMLDDAYVVHEVTPGERFEIGPFAVEARLLPHFVPNVGVRLVSAGTVLAYTGDTGPSPDIVSLSEGADLLLAEATFVETVPGNAAGSLLSAVEAGRYATEAGVRQLLLTHLWPGTDRRAAQTAASSTFLGPAAVGVAGMFVDLRRRRS